MNKVIFLFIIVICSIHSSKAQTTQTEYTYITKGYKEGLSNGADLKRGYGMRFGYASEYFDKGGGQQRRFKVYHFFKESQPRKTTAYMLLLEDRNGGLDWVFCIPSTGSDIVIWNQFWNEAYASSPGIKNAIIKETSKMLMANLKDLEK